MVVTIEESLGRLERCSRGYRVSGGLGGYDNGGHVMDVFMKKLMEITEEVMIIATVETHVVVVATAVTAVTGAARLPDQRPERRRLPDQR
ncbi:BnaA06g38210D [Brassica napus]|uniref:BnaA06g38210D protein n=3 Tax=Brassica TaxID=3705 RepID=A0A078IU25_BRANA|nr:BnaA06g38210D [Brassica napus]